MNLINLWLDQPVWLILTSLAGMFLAIALILFALSFSRATQPWSRSLIGVVAPFFGAASVLFGLLTGFLANDVWERNRQASRAVLAERDALVATYQLSIATVSDMAHIRAALRAYVESVVKDEWPRMENGEASSATAAALGEVMRVVADPKLASESGAAPHQALLDLVLKLRSARSDRIALSEQSADPSKWLSVIILAILTQISIALVHLDKPRAQLAALVIFSAAATTALGLVAVREYPFAGALQVSPQPLRDAVVAMAPEPRSAPAQ